jgi:hypothetical protein
MDDIPAVTSWFRTNRTLSLAHRDYCKSDYIEITIWNSRGNHQETLWIRRDHAQKMRDQISMLLDPPDEEVP